MFPDSLVMEPQQKTEEEMTHSAQVVWNWGKGETQHAFIAKLEKQPFHFTNYASPFFFGILYVTEFQYKLLCERLWILDESLHSYTYLKFLWTYIMLVKNTHYQYFLYVWRKKLDSQFSTALK